MTSITVVAGLLAYVGPGPGLSMTAALVGLLATILLALLAFFSWPIRVMLRKIRGADEPAPTSTSSPDDDDDDVGADEEE